MAAEGPENTIGVKVIILKCISNTPGDGYMHMFLYFCFLDTQPLFVVIKTTF